MVSLRGPARLSGDDGVGRHAAGTVKLSIEMASVVEKNRITTMGANSFDDFVPGQAALFNAC
ncbi:MAG: hypothetical protein FWG25_07650 [Promicromonosporaceae bacterium]|nr:hypothetical protein [Promicromonosporaceae bacterium]